MASGVDLQTARDIRTLFITHLIGLAFFYYDYLLTIGDEINSIWCRPKGQSTYWYILNRYLAFFSNIAVTILRSWSLSEQSCRKFNWFRQMTLLGNQVIVCILLTIRTYALYGGSRPILYFMAVAGVILFSISVISATIRQSNSHLQGHSGCHIAFSKATSIRLAVPWEALFAYDAIVFGLTIFRSYQLGYRRGPVLSVSVPLVYLVVRDGALYFAIMAIANLANILTFYFAGPYMRGGLSTFSSCISITMISRLMLNLHRSADQGIFTTELSNETNTHTHTRGGMILTSRFDTRVSSVDESDMGWEMQRFSAFSEGASPRSPTLVNH